MHVGIVGPRLARDTELLARLSGTHLVTISHSRDAFAGLAGLAAMALFDVLVLEANAGRDDLTHLVAHLRQQDPQLTLVLVDGGLTQLEIAELFRLGVADYFATPWNDALLAERIDVLAMRHRVGTFNATTTGEHT